MAKHRKRSPAGGRRLPTILLCLAAVTVTSAATWRPWANSSADGATPDVRAATSQTATTRPTSVRASRDDRERPVSTTPALGAGPHLIKAYPQTGTLECRRQAGGGDERVRYESVLDVLGPLSRHDWLMAVPLEDSSTGSVAAYRTVPIPGGREFVFSTSVTLFGPAHDAVRVRGEDVFDPQSERASINYTPLRYRSGPATFTSGDCNRA